MARRMKGSGFEWIGEIPENWKIVPVKIAFSEIKAKNTDGAITNALKFKFGEIVSKTNFDAENDDYVADTILNYTIVEPRTIMLNGLNLNYDFKTLRTGLVKEKGIITSAYLALKPNEDIVDAEYATFLFKGYESKMAFHNMGSGIRLTLGFKEFKNQPLLLPSMSEQQAIVDCIYKICAEIDSIISKTKATIEEYKKLKQSVITEAVTKGVRGARTMKDSGIEWIGEIPAHWEIRKGKWILSRLERPVKDDDGVITCFRDGEVTLRSKRREDGFTFSLQEVGYQGIEPGDLVVHGMDGFAGAIGISDSRGKGTPVLNVLDSNQDKRYVMYYLRNMAYNGIFLALATGIRVRSCDTNWNKLKELSYLLPPLEEQKQIADYLDKKCAEIDTLIEKKTALLAEMETYKKSVIYEYVTGKKECMSSVAQETVVAIYPYFPATLNTDKPRFAQAILMSRILDKCRIKMGRVKLEKMLYIIENSIGFDFDTQYVREAAGPLDSSIYECERIISRRNKWFVLNSSKYGVSYIPEKQSSNYIKYYDKYFKEYDAEIDRIINIFMNYDADQSEIIATLFAAWNDAIIDRKDFSAEEIVDDVLNNWNDSKKRFSKDVWLRAIEEMRKNNLIPNGYGKHTVVKN